MGKTNRRTGDQERSSLKYLKEKKYRQNKKMRKIDLVEYEEGDYDIGRN